MCGNGGKWVKNAVFCPKIDFYSEIGVILLHNTNFPHYFTKSLDSPVVIAYKSKFFWFCVTWGDVGSNPTSGTWFFFFVQINYFKLFMYACISYNDKKQSKVMVNLLKITINFWTLCIVEFKCWKFCMN